MKKEVAIIHFNTPVLTQAAVLSLRKHGGHDYHITIFDNSDTLPYERRMRGVTVIDNTKGQVIDFEKELAKFPDRDRTIGCAKGCEFGSVKHMMTVQKLWELLPEGFVLMESDILIKKNIDEFFNPSYSVYGYWQKSQPHNPFGIGRMLPMLCWMNVPMLTKHGARYYDPARTYGLLPGGARNRNNWYDTGAVLLEDILAKRPHLKGWHVDIREFVEHYGSASWKNNDQDAQKMWLEQHRNLWDAGAPNAVAVCAIGRLENRYAVEWVEHYNKLGVDKIFIYDNNHIEDSEVFADVLQPYIEAGFVEIIPFCPDSTGNIQRTAYEDCYNHHGEEYAWIGFFDFDEFVEIQDGRSVHDLLRGYDFADVLVLNWRTMTDSGQLHYEDKPVKERFTDGTDEQFPINRHVKSFVRTGIDGIQFKDPHCPNAPQLLVVNVHGISVPQEPLQNQVIHNVARIDHYDTKSAEEWVTVKLKRGIPSGQVNSDNLRKHNIEYFFSINQRTPEKEVILGVVEPPSFDEAQGTPTAKKASKPKGKKSTNKKGK